MSNILNKFNNIFNINIKNKKNKFCIKNSYINKFSKLKLLKLKRLNVINFKNNNNVTTVDLKFFENKFTFKNINKWK